MLRVRGGFLAVCCLTLAALSGGCRSKETQPEKPVNDDSARIAAMLRECEANKQALQSEIERLMRDMAGKDGEIARWRTEAEASRATSSKLQKELEEFASRTPGTRALDGGVLFEESLLFDPGKAELKAGGRNALDMLTDLLRGKDAYLRVEGHTDSDPIQKSASLWKTRDNFELGAYRALAVTVYLKSKGVSGTRMYLASYGEHKPMADNSSKENKQKNRRVEIYIFDRKG